VGGVREDRDRRLDAGGRDGDGDDDWRACRRVVVVGCAGSDVRGERVGFTEDGDGALGFGARSERGVRPEEGAAVILGEGDSAGGIFCIRNNTVSWKY
jgi:hypothetical protein